jgi:translation initiation factor 2-alpha kinase 4
VTSSNEPYSRYRSDFEEIQFLGKGAFGAVIKVRNRIDNRFYAVKRIKLDPRDPEENQKILREVTTISRLHHDRITRYYQAWIEGDMSGFTSAPSSRHQSKSRSKEDNGEDSKEEHDEFSDANTFGREDWLGFDHTIDTTPHQSFSSLLDLSINHTGFSEPETHDDGSQQATESWDPAQQIQFERDSNGNDNDESLPSDEYSSDESSESPKEDPSKQLLLYIQMEYCPNQTLRDVIDEGGLDMAEVWRLFRQVLEGLAYIHGQGMIHRDLKPSNIFLDSNGDIKIGDFGLAVVDSPGTHPADAPPKAIEDKEHLSLAGLSLTGAVGTPFYMSPEQEQPGTSRYSHRVDMYALGIIFVELCCGQFATAMERVVMLRAVRSPSITLPPIFDKPDMAQPKAIAKSLLSHNPKDRMDASVLMARPDLVPPKMEDEAVNEAIRSLSSPGSPHYPKLVRAVFGQQGTEAAAFKDFTFDMHSGLITDVSMLKRITQIKAGLTRLFETHGAIEFPTPLLNLPKTSPASDAVRLLDSHGSLVSLPGNLVEPFARFVSHNRLGELKRFSFDRTFRSNPAGGQPLHFLEAAFDICFPLADDSSIHEAHAIKVAMDAVTRTCEIDDVTIHLGHRKLVDVLGRMAGVAEGKRNHFYNLLVTKKTSWSKHKQILSVQLGIPVLAFEQLTPFSRPLTFQKVSSLLKQEADSLALLTPISRLVERLEILGIDGKHVLLDLMAGGESGSPYTGLTFQIYPATGLHRENSSPLIVGGRYDHLLVSYSYPHLTNMGAVGFTVTLPRLALYLPQTPSLVDVLVYSAGDSEDTLLPEKLSILAELWANNIHADLLPSSAKPSQEHLIRVGKRMGVSVMVLVKEQHQSGAKGKIVKVKDLERRSETEVQRSDLVETLLKMQNQQPEQAPSQTILSAGVATQQRESMFRVHLLMTSSATTAKMKPSQRSAISERAIKALSPLMPALAKPIEIIAHDLSAALVEIAAGFGSEDAAKAGEREAVSRMKAQLKLLRDRGDQLVALFNYKEGSVQIIPLFISTNNH